MDQLIKPGASIKPRTTNEDVRRLLLELYGIVAREIREINAYDDKNYLISVDRDSQENGNSVLTGTPANKFVLKILNSNDSKKTSFIEGQAQLTIFLTDRGFRVPVIVKNLQGEYYSIETISEAEHVVRLFEFRPGKILGEVPTSDNLLYQCGEYLGKMTCAMKTFTHPGLEQQQTIWMMDHIPQLRQFLYAVKDDQKLRLIETVLDQFETRIIPNLSLYARSIIHGDYNEQNILVDYCESSNDYQLAGVLDFGDTSCSCVVFDLAIAMTYLMLQSESLRTGGLVLAGYRATRPVPQHELAILRICVAARLCQSMVMASYSYSLDPGNDYIMVSQAKAWKLMQLIWPQTDDAVLNIWLTTADLYATKSAE